MCYKQNKPETDTTLTLDNHCCSLTASVSLWYTAYPLFVLKCPHSVPVQQSHKLSWVKVTTGLQQNTFLTSYLQRLRIHYFSAFQCLKFHHKIQEY